MHYPLILMLYDIASPIIFFLSLGGIIIITGRVVIRIRRQQFTHAIQSHAAATPLHSMFDARGAQEVSSLLQPSKKSVRVIGSRVGLWRQQAQQQVASARQWWEARRSRSAAVAAPMPNIAAGVTAPSRGIGAFRRLKKAAGALSQIPHRFNFTRKEVRPTVPVATSAAHIATTPAASFTLTRSEAHNPAAPAVTDPMTVSVSRSAASAAQVRRSSLVRRAHPAEDRTPKANARAALASGQYEKVENVLVPYIVKHPKDTEAYMLLGRAALGREAWSEAMEIFEQIISWNEDEVGAYAGLGTAAYKSGKFTRALQALQRAHDAEPHNREVLDSLVAIAQKMDNHGLLHSLQEEIKQLPVN